jgi:hypothetical protein
MNQDRQIVKNTSKRLYNNVLYEQIYDKQRNTSYFLGLYEDKKILVDYIEDNNIRYDPVNDSMLEKGAVVLPSDILEYNTVEELDTEINDFINRYLDITEEHRKKAVWYVRLSWVTDNLNTIPYLRALGDYGSGKTRYEDTIGGICYKPMYVGGSVRSPPIYRTIDQWHGTAIFDEFTLSHTEETADIIQILNCGYQRGKPVLRCNDANYSKVDCFDPFGPKILASKKPFSDRALESRCITEIVQETSRNDIPIDLGKKFFEERGLLQNKLLLYRLRNWTKIKHDENIKIDFGHIQPRIKQTYLPFTVLFQNDPTTLNGFIQTIIKKNKEIVEENANSLDGLIVNIYCELKLYNVEGIVTPQDIRNDLVDKHGYSEDKFKAATVGKHLTPLGFKSIPKRLGDKIKRDVTIEPSALNKLIYRYVLPEKQKEFFESPLFMKKLEVE